MTRYLLSLVFSVCLLNSYLSCQGTIGDQTGSVSSVLTVTPVGSGTGSVTSVPSGISACANGGGGTCSHTYLNGTTIILTPTTTGGSTFAWSTGTDGASVCSGTGACTFTITGTASVLAIFTGAGGGTIPNTPTFAIDVVANTSYPSTISHGQLRVWDTPGSMWSFINTSNGVYTYTTLDTVLNFAATANVHTAQYGLGARVPNWASSNTNLNVLCTVSAGPFTANEAIIQNTTGTAATFISYASGTMIISQYVNPGIAADSTDDWVGQTSAAHCTPSNSPVGAGIPTGCAGFSNGKNAPGQLSGQCYPPTDITSTGTGTDLIWRNWVASIVTHVNQAGYVAGTGSFAGTPHAHIVYWEVWNEPYATGKFWGGSYDQLIRFAQDAACIISKNNGAGFVQATGESCATVRASVTSVVNCCDGANGPGDPTAQIVMPSYAPQSYNLAACFLYCTPNSTNQCGTPATSCISGHGGASAIDRINFHAKPGANLETAIPSQVTAVNAQLAGPELSKPIDDTEAGFSATGWLCPNSAIFSTCYTDPQMQAGYIARMYVYYYFSGVANDVWYNWSPPAGFLGSPNAAVAYTTVYNWMVGSTAPVCTHVGTPPNAVYTCTMTSALSVATGMLWDTSKPCGGTPSTCSFSTQTVASHYQSYLDITGAKFTIPQPGLGAHQVSVSIVPILLQDTP